MRIGGRDYKSGDSTTTLGVRAVAKSVLEAIREGDWYFEPEELDSQRFDATIAIPGTREKLDVLAERVNSGLPLWHRKDRPDYEEVEQGRRGAAE